MQQLMWWNWPIEKIMANVDLLCNSDVNGLLLRNGIGSTCAEYKENKSLLKKIFAQIFK
jgi:hypothetical protein